MMPIQSSSLPSRGATLTQAQKLAGRLPPLLIAAERVAQSVYAGIHGRRRAGVGETFWQFRPYESGDPTERIDWRQSARTDKVFIREREWEAAQTLCLWADRSGSMQFSSHKNIPTKFERAQLFMLALASLGMRGGENLLWLDGPSSILLRGKDALQRLVGQFDTTSATTGNVWPQARLPRHAAIVLCSDFLMTAQELRAQMRYFAAQKIKGILLHILDPAEEHFGYRGRIDLHGLEEEAMLRLPDAGALQQAYAQKMTAHKAELANIARSAGWLYLTHVTAAAPEATLAQLYTWMSHA